MNASVHRSSRHTPAKVLRWTAIAAISIGAVACSSDDDESTSTAEAPATEPAPATEAPTTEAPTTEAATTDAPTTDAPDETTGDDTETSVADTEPADDGGDNFSTEFPDLAPPTGEELVIGLVNTEGTPGLDFPDIRIFSQATADYLNEHGGFGGRPVRIENCTAKGSPETSQACAQELTGKGVELILLGLDLFPDYATYTAAGLPVIGVLPILPGDYTANALFITGGNATSTAAMAAAAKDYYQAETVAIVSSDNPGANGTEASLTAALDVAGIAHTTVKGGDNETDAGYQGLMREAASGNPDLLVSLYSDAGCIGTIRGRAALGIEIPVITTSICAGKDVIDAVGDDALGWSFVGIQTQEQTPELDIFQEILAPALGVEPSEVDSTATGLGGLGVIQMMSLAEYSNRMAADGQEVTGTSLYEFLGTATGLNSWPNGAPIECGAAPAYPSICTFTFPVAEYHEGGEVLTVPGLEAVSAKPYLP